MTKALTMIRDLIEGRLQFKGIELLEFAGDLIYEVCSHGCNELEAIDPEFARILDQNIDDICDAIEDCSPAEEKLFIERVKALYDHALAVYYQRHPGAKEPE